MIASRLRFSIVVLFLLIGFVSGTAYSQSIALNTRVTSFGPGAAATVQISSTVNVRSGMSYLPISRNGVLENEVDVAYDVTGELAAVTLFVDWHPFDNVLRVSAGAVYDRSHVESSGQPAESYELQGSSFSPEKLGQVEADLSFANTVHPYLGIGLGNSVRGSRLDVFFDFGAMYVNQAEVNVEGAGLISATANQESDLNEALRSFPVLPYVALGMSVSL